jgi:glucose uptake protein
MVCIITLKSNFRIVRFLTKAQHALYGNYDVPMILPGSSSSVLTLLILGMICWGLWASMYKAAGEKWRFELFYFDFAVGVVLSAVIIGLTFGNLGFDGFSLSDDLRLAGKRQDLFAFVAGMIFNLGNMLVVAAVSLSGLSLAFPVAMGFGLVMGALWSFALNAGGNPLLLFAGAAVVAGAVVTGILARSTWLKAQVVSPVLDDTTPGKKVKRKKKSTGSKAVLVSLAGGVLIGSWPPFIQMARAGENGLGPYSIGLIFSLGILISTFVFNLFFMNLPVQGEPVEMSDYFRAKMKRHGQGILGGILWYAGMIAILIGGRVEGAAQVAPALSYGLSQGSIIVAALCGILIWKEFANAEMKVKAWLGLMLVLLIVGTGLVSFATVAPAQ